MSTSFDTDSHDETLDPASELLRQGNKFARDEKFCDAERYSSEGLRPPLFTRPSPEQSSVHVVVPIEAIPVFRAVPASRRSIFLPSLSVPPSKGI